MILLSKTKTKKQMGKKTSICVVSISCDFFAGYISKIISAKHGTFSRLCGMKSDGRVVDNEYKKNNVFILGLYYPTDPRWYRIRLRKGILLFAGHDIGELQSMDAAERQKLFSFLKSQNITFATESPIIQKRIKHLFDLDTEVVYLPAAHSFLDIPDPLPEIFNVGCYLDHGNYYYHDLILSVVRKMPDISFNFYNIGGYEPNNEEKGIGNLICYRECISDMREFLKGISCGLRITIDDTYSMSAIEYNMAGRMFINNHEMPYCMLLPDKPTEEEVMNNIRLAASNNALNLEGKCFYDKNHKVEFFRKFLKRIFSS